MNGRQGNGDGNDEDKDDKNRKRFRDTKYDFEEEDEEESDTEDSFEFEITPQQLSQVTPGGGILKLTLTKKGPLKITTEPQKKPDPSQTTVKTVYDPTKEKEPLQGSKSIKDKTTYRERENFEGQRIKSKEIPNGKKEEGYPKGGVQLDKLNQVVMVVLMGMGDQVKVENHPERRKDHQMGLEK